MRLELLDLEIADLALADGVGGVGPPLGEDCDNDRVGGEDYDDDEGEDEERAERREVTQLLRDVNVADEQA